LQAFFERALALPAGAVTHRARGVL
jgi:hypothetical protein